MHSLQDKIVIVTGSDSGIGQAVAEAVAKAGADVVITWFHDEAGGQETERRVKAAGRKTLLAQLDVRRPEQAASLFDKVEKTLGTPFILVNNAGVSGDGKPGADTSVEDWDNVISTNLSGPFFFCQHFIRARRRAGGRGRIINITSVHEEIVMQDAAAYDASKGGLRNLTRTLALELAPDKINVNNVAPDMVLTPMNQKAVDDLDVRHQREQRIPWKRAGLPSEIAQLVLFLASDDADYVTGQSFTMDGGLSINLGQGA